MILELHLSGDSFERAWQLANDLYVLRDQVTAAASKAWDYLRGDQLIHARVHFILTAELLSIFEKERESVRQQILALPVDPQAAKSALNL